MRWYQVSLAQQDLYVETVPTACILASSAEEARILAHQLIGPYWWCASIIDSYDLWKGAVQREANKSGLALGDIWDRDDYDLKNSAYDAFVASTPPDVFFSEAFADDLARAEGDRLGREEAQAYYESEEE